MDQRSSEQEPGSTPWLSRRGEILAVIILLALQLAFLLPWAVRNDFVTFRQDSGETFVAFRQSGRLRETFPRFGLLHVQADSTGEKVYTHNVNLGTLYFFFLRSLGISERETLTLCVLPVYLAGLLLACLAVRKWSGSGAVAGFFLILMVLDFANVGAFAFNALRAWHYVALFGTLHALGRLLSPEPGQRRGSSLLLLAFSATVAFGCGYDFFVIVGAVAGAVTLACFPRRQWLPMLGWLAGCFFLPFLLRQIEVAYWMGLRTWLTDFYYTFAIKVPFVTRLVHIPSVAEIDAIYARAGLMRPPAYPTSDWAGIWQTLEPLIRLAVIPRYGVIGCGLALLGTAAFLVGACLRLSRFPLQLLRLPALYFIGICAGLLVFAPFSLHVYLKHDFPLVAALIHLTEAVALGLALALWRTKSGRMPVLHRTAALAAFGFLAGNTLAVTAGNSAHSKELDHAWIREVRQRTKESSDPAHPGLVASSFLFPAQARSVIDPDHLTLSRPDQVPWILAQAAGLLVQKPVLTVPDFPAPAFALYAPTDGWCNLDAREPDLSHHDWLLRRLHAASWAQSGPPALHLRSSSSSLLRPGDVIHVSYGTDAPSDWVPDDSELALMVTDSQGRTYEFKNIVDELPLAIPTGAAALTYNARFGSFEGYLRLPPERVGEVTGAFSIRGVIRYRGQSAQGDPVTVTFSPSAPPQNDPVILVPEPTVAQLRRAVPREAIAREGAVGAGFLLLNAAAFRPYHRPQP